MVSSITVVDARPGGRSLGRLSEEQGRDDKREEDEDLGNCKRCLKRTIYTRRRGGGIRDVMITPSWRGTNHTRTLAVPCQQGKKKMHWLATSLEAVDSMV